MHKSLAFVTMCCFSFCTFSQDETDIFALTLEELTQIEIATKHKQTIYSSPSSVYVITRQQIKNMGIQNLQTLLNFVPGFQSTRDIEQGTTNRISARGRSTALSESVLVQIDGNKINDLYTGGISILNRLLDIGHVDHIEIIRGPGSALYGSNAFLGVINIITLSAHNEINLAVTHPNKVSSNLIYAHQFSTNNTIDLYLSAFDDQGDDFYLTDIYGISDNVADPATGIDVYLKHAVNDWLFTGRYINRTLNDFMPLGSIGNNINQEKSQQWSLTAEYSKVIFENFSYRILLSHSQDKWETIALLIPKDVEIFPDFSLTSNFVGGPFLTSKNNKVAIQLNYQANNDHLFSFGGSFEEAAITDVYTATTHNLFTLDAYEESIKLTGDQSFNAEKSREIVSLYIQDQIYINDYWELTAGLRYDHYNDFGNSTSPRLALVWKPKERSSVKFMYGTAFRAPNFLELYDRNNYVDFGNTSLNAEEVETIEISWLHSHSNWHIELTAFNNAFKQLILLGQPVEDPENPFFAPSFTNNDGQKSRGLETELLYKFNKHISVKALWNWFSDDSDINVAKNAGAIILDYHKEKLHMNIHGFYRGKNNAIVGQDSYVVASTNIVYQMSPRFTVNFSMNNIFNQDYRTQSIMYDAGIENRGRTLTLGIEYQL
ncbi:TonB-dependent receptor plug domain-containing protein [Colwelliaceae bacterium 6471]